MLDNLTEKLGGAMKVLRGHAKITEENVGQAVREVRLALLEADVALPVVKTFVEELKAQAMGEAVMGSLTPAQAFVGLAHAKIKGLMGEVCELNLAVPAPAVLMMCGLQGVGKTTTCGKLAKLLREGRRKVLLASCDVNRPAAMRQLEVLAASVGADFYAEWEGKDALGIAQGALRKAKTGHYDALVMDTAGRLSVDDAMMEELAQVHAELSPAECLLVVDAMMGQQALSVAQAFAAKVALTGLALTKLDGDGRGGAMLSARSVTGLPIKLAGVSERMDGLERFDPERMAGRVLGMGDIVGLVEQARRHHDEKAAAKLEEKFKSGAGFDLDDFHAQIKQMRAMGGVSSFMEKLPMAAQRMAQQAPGAAGDKQLARMEGIIASMTPKERAKPELMKGSRKVRVAKGAGVQVMHVNQLLKQYETVASLMKGLQHGGLGKLMRKMSGAGGSKAKGGKRRK